MLEDAIRHMGVIQAALEHLSPRLYGLMANVVNNDKATALEVGREAGRLEQVLSEFVDGYLEVKASHAGADSSQARTLVMEVYRHHARSVCRWLEEMAWVTSYPEAAIRQRGLGGSTEVVFKIRSEHDHAAADGCAAHAVKAVAGIARSPKHAASSTNGASCAHQQGAGSA
jgi:hypothetical protein